MGHKLNYGCGETKLPDCINVDVDAKGTVKPDVVCDIRKGNLPFEKDHFSTVYAMHVIEHIEQKYWPALFDEFRRVLEPEGKLILAYPEFEICAKYFIENYMGARDYWRMTLFGRQSWPGDYHVVPMRTPEVINYLRSYGFVDIKHTSEHEEGWSTFIACSKGINPPTRVELYKKEVFNK
jgi:predicted SAM-dependent methyltransferase